MSTKNEPVTVGVLEQMYEDRRTHRCGILVGRNEKFKTLLMESPDGSTFNITFAQFKSNWRKKFDEVPAEENINTEVDAPVKQEVEPELSDVETPNNVPVTKAVVGKKRYGGPTEEKKSELKQDFTDGVLIANKYIDSFENEDLSLKVDVAKKKVLIKYRANVIADVDIMSKHKACRVWLREHVANTHKWSIEPNAITQYPWSGRNISATFDLASLETVLNDLRQVIIDFMVESNKSAEEE